MEATSTKPASGRHEFNPDSPVFRIRTGSPLKKRYEKIGEKRGCDPSTVAKEGLLRFAKDEEARLGIESHPQPEGSPK